MILEDNELFCNENHDFMAGGSINDHSAMLHVGIHDKEDRTQTRMVFAHLDTKEMKDLRDFIDKILKTCESKESE